MNRHEAQWQLLLKSNRYGRLPHALLLTGIKGIGKLSFAKAFARFLLCESTHKQACQDLRKTSITSILSEDRDARNASSEVVRDVHEHASVGAVPHLMREEIQQKTTFCECRSCQLIQAGTHPDLYLIQPAQEDSVIKIDKVRELIERAQQTAYLSSQQIVIIEPAEQMNIAAANALLKTLEEPIGSVIFILVSHQFHFLPMTIRSRCQKIYFPEIDTSYLPTSLEENFFQQLIAMLEEKLDPITLAAWCVKNVTATEVLSWLMHWTIDTIRMTMGLPKQFLSMDIKNTKFSTVQLFFYFDKLMTTKKRLQEKINLNQQLLLESLLCEIFQ